MPAANRRNTRRKQVIRSLLHDQFDGGPVLLSELRWAVVQNPDTAEAKCHDQLSISLKESITRTIRSMSEDEDLNRYALSPVSQLPFGVVAREALFRHASHATIRQFLRCKKPVQAVRWDTVFLHGRPISKPEFSLWDLANRQSVILFPPAIKINSGRPLLFVSSRVPTKKQVRLMGRYEWGLAHLRLIPMRSLDYLQYLKERTLEEEETMTREELYYGKSSPRRSFVELIPEVINAPLDWPKHTGGHNLREFGVKYKITKV